ncbi:MAG: PKD domain-containing protein, partial [Bacteroidales bacterium]|nr:PKD domain-containing protein [Bacteroidales bacterium]
APLSSTSIQNPVFNTTGSGNYRLTYTVIDNNGCSATDNVIIKNDHPTSLFNMDAYSGCGSVNISFTNTSSNAVKYIWDFGDGSALDSVNVSPVHTFVNITTSVLYYTVELTAISPNNCEATTSQVITVYPIIEAEIITTPDTVCHPGLIQLTGTQGAAQYFWDYGDGTSGYAGNSVLHNFTNTTEDPVTFTVKLTTTSFFGCDDDTEEQVVVYPSPVANFSADPAYQIYPAATVDFSNLTNAGKWDFKWDFDDGNTSTEGNPTHTYDQPGDYRVLLEVSNEQCTDTISHLVTVSPALPIAQYDPVESGCMPWTLQFNNTSVFADTYQWSFGDGSISNAENPEYTYFEAGSYIIRLTVTGPGGTDEYVQVIEVYQEPVAKFSFTPDFVYVNDQAVHCLNRSLYADSYLWEFGDGQTDTSRDAYHAYSAEGEYYITLTVYTDNGCEDTHLADQPVTVEPAGEVRYPTAFRPNMNNEGSDGGQDVTNIPASEINQYFFPPIQEKVDDYHLQIFNRWGEMLFESHDINIGWTGYYKGKLCKQDVYVWLVEGKYSNGKPFKKAGDITLLY